MTSGPRMRMFAGPNGSGKSALKLHLPPGLLGIYLNPDEIEQSIRTRGYLDFSEFDVRASAEEIAPFLTASTLLNSSGFAEAASTLQVVANRLEFGRVDVNAYFASVIAEFLRRKLLQQRFSFTFETVMSHPGKVQELKNAQVAGYRTYLYFIATDDPEINISRVRTRVKLGGHSVPEGRIVDRYHRSLSLLMDAIRNTNRAYIFDNSGDKTDHTWLAEITEGKELELKSRQIPAWFKRAVLDKT